MFTRLVITDLGDGEGEGCFWNPIDLNMAQEGGSVSVVIPRININGDISDTLVPDRIKDKLRIN